MPHPSLLYASLQPQELCPFSHRPISAHVLGKQAHPWCFHRTCSAPACCSQPQDPSFQEQLPPTPRPWCGKPKDTPILEQGGEGWLQAAALWRKLTPRPAALLHNNLWHPMPGSLPLWPSPASSPRSLFPHCCSDFPLTPAAPSVNSPLPTSVLISPKKPCPFSPLPNLKPWLSPILKPLLAAAAGDRQAQLLSTHWGSETCPHLSGQLGTYPRVRAHTGCKEVTLAPTVGVIPPPLPSAHSVASWVTRLPRCPIFLERGREFPVMDGGALKAVFPEAEPGAREGGVV